MPPHDNTTHRSPASQPASQSASQSVPHCSASQPASQSVSPALFSQPAPRVVCRLHNAWPRGGGGCGIKRAREGGREGGREGASVAPRHRVLSHNNRMNQPAAWPHSPPPHPPVVPRGPAGRNWVTKYEDPSDAAWPAHRHKNNSAILEKSQQSTLRAELGFFPGQSSPLPSRLERVPAAGLLGHFCA